MRPRTNTTTRHRLPQRDGGLFLTDSGLETTLIFHEGWALPCFEAFTLLASPRGVASRASRGGGASGSGLARSAMSAAKSWSHRGGMNMR